MSGLAGGAPVDHRHQVGFRPVEEGRHAADLVGLDSADALDHLVDAGRGQAERATELDRPAADLIEPLLDPFHDGKPRTTGGGLATAFRCRPYTLPHDVRTMFLTRTIRDPYYTTHAFLTGKRPARPRRGSAASARALCPLHRAAGRGGGRAPGDRAGDRARGRAPGAGAHCRRDKPSRQRAAGQGAVADVAP